MITRPRATGIGFGTAHDNSIFFGRFCIGGRAGAGFERFRTTCQNYYGYDTKALSVGESNQGIVVRWMAPMHPTSACQRTILYT